MIYLEYLFLGRCHPHDQRGTTDDEYCASRTCQFEDRAIEETWTYAEMALMYVPIPGMVTAVAGG